MTVNRHAPVALVVQGDVERAPGDVELDGTPSYDPNGGELFYHWRFVDGPPEAGQIEVVSPTQSIARVRPLKQGHYIFELIVNNGSLSSRPAEFHVNVVNVAPVAMAGENQDLSLVAGDETEVALDGTLSFDPNPEDVITYQRLRSVDPLSTIWSGRTVIVQIIATIQRPTGSCSLSQINGAEVDAFVCGYRLGRSHTCCAPPLPCLPMDARSLLLCGQY